VNARPRRRRAKRLALRGFRLLRRHYLTLLSTAVIAALAIVALRSDAFSDSGRVRPELPPLAQNTFRGEDIGHQYLQSIIWSPPEAELGLRSIVYFLYEEDDQATMMQLGLRDLSRARYKLDEGGPEDTNIFLRVATPEEQAAIGDTLAEAETLARLQGYSFEVVDLRSEFN
jgi:hypothetical protein